MAGRPILPAGAPLWSERPPPSPPRSRGARLRPVGRRRGLPGDINGAVRRDRGQTPVRPRAGPTRKVDGDETNPITAPEVPGHQCGASRRGSRDRRRRRGAGERVGEFGFVPGFLRGRHERADQHGPVCGIVGNGVSEWLGIPYAAPPVGALRWQPPQPHAPWTTTLHATAFGSECTQPASPTAASPPWTGSENCLFVNVWRPPGTTSAARLPVMVHIHGGGLRRWLRERRQHAAGHDRA